MAVDPDGLATADLTTTSDFTFALLDGTHLWRHRLVEEFTFESASHVIVRSGYQLELPADLVAPFGIDGRHARARIILPLTTRPKRPLLGFDIQTSGGGPAHLLPRLSIAAIEAEYLALLRDEAANGDPLLTQLLPTRLLEAVCVHAPDVYDAFDTKRKRDAEHLAKYLTAGLGFDVRASDARQLRDEAKGVGEILARHLQEPSDPSSSAESIIAALPQAEPRPTSVTEALALVRGFAAGVRLADDRGDSSLLVALAEYGRRWEMLIEMVVPLQESWLITLTERQPLGLSRGQTRQLAHFGDARSAHAQFAASDPAVEIAKWRVEDVFRAPVAVPPLEGARATRESLALYSSDPERPYFVDVEITLRPSIDVRIISYALEVLVLVAIVFAALVESSDLTGRIALATTPTTFAVALALIRDETSLARRLMRFGRFRLLAGVAMLWLVAFGRLI